MTVVGATSVWRLNRRFANDPPRVVPVLRPLKSRLAVVAIVKKPWSLRDMQGWRGVFER